LAGKYGAPAVAVVVVDASGSTAVAGWSRGHSAVWNAAPPSGSPRATALAGIDAAFAGMSSGSGAFAEGYGFEEEPKAASQPRVAVTGVRDGPMGEEYRVESGDAAAIEALWSAPGVSVVERLVSGRPAVVIAVSGGSVAEVLRAGGFVVDPAG
jgi:hypothetical protein